MQVWSSLLVVVQMLAAIAMIVLVLIQHGKGADMGASFGSGASGSLFGATGSANFLSRFTAVCAAIFFASTLGLALLSNKANTNAAAESGSVLERAVPASSAAPTVPQIPSAAPAPVVPASAAAASATR
ncbi:preprotein translocase subunit SecG [Ideonella sp.]|jgi:preprotein translocase subunit SecG|uniref:preprotein translocase subunit SecG n=1 Tax=Ideonella sp. TaxID=1929293 RepID=UPI0037C147CD